MLALFFCRVSSAPGLLGGHWSVSLKISLVHDLHHTQWSRLCQGNGKAAYLSLWRIGLFQMRILLFCLLAYNQFIHPILCPHYTSNKKHDIVDRID